MVSALSLMVARGSNVPVIDPRLRTHVAFSEVVSQLEEPVVSTDAEDDKAAPAQQTSKPESDQ